MNTNTEAVEVHPIHCDACNSYTVASDAGVYLCRYHMSEAAK